MSKQNKYTRSARGKACHVRLYQICNHDPETTVLAHKNGGGMSAKHLDIHGAYACSDCHAWLDGGYVNKSTRKERDAVHDQAILLTQITMVEDGILVL